MVKESDFAGTLPFVSPEQTGRVNRAVDWRSDLWAMGVVLYQMATGQLPFISAEARRAGAGAPHHHPHAHCSLHCHPHCPPSCCRPAS